MEKNNKTKIMVIDDATTNVLLLQNILEAQGFEVISAYNGMEALGYLAKMTPDIILLDIMMPVMSGYEVLDEIMKSDRTSNIPVIMVTAKREADDVKKALDKGAVDYVKKPIDIVELLSRINAALRLRNRENTIKKLLKLKEQFITIASHDLRLPLIKVLDDSDALINDKELSEGINKIQKEVLKNIYDGTRNLLDYVDTLINMAFIGVDKIDIKVEKVNLFDLFDISVEKLLVNEKKKNIKIERKFAKDLFINVDATLFSLVLKNLIEYLSASLPIDGKLAVSTYQKDNKNVITISDSDSFVDSDNKERLLNEFYSTDYSMEKGSNNFRIIKKIIEAHGFDIKVNTEQEREFSITLN